MAGEEHTVVLVHSGQPKQGGVIVYIVPEGFNGTVEDAERSAVAITWVYPDGEVQQFRADRRPRWRGLGAHA